MKQEDKELLLQDLSARLPYGVKVKFAIPALLVSVRNDRDGIKIITESTYSEHIYNIEDIKPYLRPMSSMTEEEKKEYQSLCVIYSDHDADDNVTYYYFDTVESFDWLNKKMFDYRELIPKGCAIAVTEDNNPYNK